MTFITPTNLKFSVFFESSYKKGKNLIFYLKTLFIYLFILTRASI